MGNIGQRPLFIYEMANNHMGDVEHGIRIVRELKAASEGFPFAFCVKLQYRDIASCIHPAYKDRFDLKYVKRFSETHLSWENYKRLKDAIVEAGFLSMCTPWDENSVDKIVEHGFDFMKIPSCYVSDWPLLERIAQYDLPIVASTAGEPLEEIDRVVSFFKHREKSLAIMHCVGEYPAPDDHLHLGQIALLKKRYPELEVGYSTHERPDNFEAVKIAIALGAVMFEKHVGVPTEKYAINAYSATPAQVRKWLESASDAMTMMGSMEKRYPAPPGEQAALRDLARGAFVRQAVKAGEVIDHANVFFAMPNVKDQLVAQDFSKYSEYVAKNNIAANGPVMTDEVTARNTRELVYKIVSDVKSLIKKSKVQVPGQCDLEISHHYGLEKFRESGLTAITVVNREYCKRLMVVLPGQKHPEQWHNQKDETYHILYGDVTVELDGKRTTHKSNSVITISHGVKHSFWTTHGAIIEEVSSSYSKDDSFYSDPAIMANGNRKTFVTYWIG
ncbi:N-acetylneuraminate synthase family protein [Occallatibacter savannae]|uniref:N-acetylneuraminate synthase family protein n=1 Tax=Occallatibacter savannae TaxID=1002691 RepID=UPI000D6856E8|nr:N-acetylneuraminate synthase family protein [Occallatibacter savannae]